MKSKTTLILLFLFFIFSIILIPVKPTISSSIPEKYSLPNGLKVILLENHSSPVVAMQAWVKVGAADEKKDEHGVSHLIEHMLFKGTKTKGVGQIAKMVEGGGGDINAYTSHDTTVFHVVIASREFDVGLDVLSDMVQNSIFDPIELKREKKVVIEEIRMGEDEPKKVLFHQIFSTAYHVHPYGRPVIGTKESVQNLSREKVFGYYKKWYRPDNIIFVAVGDFNSNIVKQKIEKAFGSFKAPSTPIIRNRPSEPKQEKTRIKIIEKEISETHLGIAFHIPGIFNKDSFALDIIATILGDGRSSRLYNILKNQASLVHTVDSFAVTPKDPGLLIIRCRLDSKDVKETLLKIKEELNKLKKVKVTPSELKKAKVKIKSDFIYEKETMQGLANKFGYFETTVGDLSFEEKYLKGIEDVTAEKIIKIAEKYFRWNNMSLVILGPKGIKKSLNKDELISLFSEKKKEKESIYAKKFTLDNGIRLIIRENHTVPMFAMNIAFLGGLRFETEKNNGITRFLSLMLTRGTKNRTAKQLAEEIESMGGNITSYSGRDSFGIEAKFLKQDLDHALDIVSDIVLHSNFPKNEVEKVRKDLKGAIKQQKDNMVLSTFKIFTKNLYANHPYGMPVLGTLSSINNIKREDLIKFYKKFIVPSNMVITIVGDINESEVRDELNKRFKSMKAKCIKFPKIPSPIPPSKIKLAQRTAQKEQAHFILGFMGLDIKDNDKYALDIISAVMSGQGGRLFKELRDKQSLAYSVAFFSREYINNGFIGIYMGTKKENLDLAVEGVKNELKKLIQKGITKEELKRAKRYLIGSYEIGLQSFKAQASYLTFDEIFGLGFLNFLSYPEKIKSVTVDDTNRVIKRLINLNKYVLAIIKPE